MLPSWAHESCFPPFSDNADDTFLHFVAPSRSNSETRSATGRPKSTGICSFPHRLLFSLLVPTNLIDSHRSFDPEERTSSVEKSWAVVIKLLPSAIVILSASWMRACVSLLGTSNKSARDSLPSSKTKTKKKDLFFLKKNKRGAKWHKWWSASAESSAPPPRIFLLSFAGLCSICIVIVIVYR